MNEARRLSVMTVLENGVLSREGVSCGRVKAGSIREMDLETAKSFGMALARLGLCSCSGVDARGRGSDARPLSLRATPVSATALRILVLDADW